MFLVTIPRTNVFLIRWVAEFQWTRIAKIKEGLSLVMHLYTYGTRGIELPYIHMDLYWLCDDYYSISYWQIS